MSSLLLALELVVTVQVSQTTVTGTIRDAESGAPLAGAVVALIDIEASTLSDGAGRYRLREVPPGPQHLTVKRIGFAPRTVHALVPGAGVLQLDLSLQPAPLQLPTIVVRSTVAIRGLEPVDSSEFPDRSISAAALRNHPLLAEPDGFLALTGGEITADPESPSGIHIRGGSSEQTAYLLDGIPIFSPYHAAGTFSAWNPDALDRLEVIAGSPSLAPPDALSGAVAGVTRAPGDELHVQGTLSTSHGRVMAHGPLGVSGAGFLLSARSGFPGAIAPSDEPSYLHAGTSDFLAKLEAPMLGGRLRVLGYESSNRIDAAAVANHPDSAPPDRRRNAYAWQSRSVGVEWSRVLRQGTALWLRGWSALGEAEATWRPLAAPGLGLESEREDQGMFAGIERRSSGRLTSAALRLERSRTAYWVGDSSLPARTPTAALFLRHRRPLLARFSADLAVSATAAARDLFIGSHAELRWRPASWLALTTDYARSHQFAQSARNAESVVGGIFPADLFVGASSPEVPVARSDLGIVAAEVFARPGLRVGAQVYARRFEGLLLVAPRAGTPFSTGDFAVGQGTSSGLSFDAAMSGARYGVTASYGWEQVRLEYTGGSYTPGYATSHLVETGIIVFPTATTSARIGITGGIGRRATGVLGALEWESCNLLDRGCEFGGSPLHEVGRPGGTRLPSYLRVDLGLRKHWHVDLAGRDVELALYGTVSNLFGRRNLLGIATDPVTGKRTEIEMRPLAPLVVGLDWRF